MPGGDDLKVMAPTIVHTSQMQEFSMGENWTMWHERLEMHFEEVGISSEAAKKSTLLKTIGTEAYQVIHSICSPEAPGKKTYDDLCALLKQQFTTPVIIYQERKKFYTAVRAPNESVSKWYARVKKLAIDCKFGNQLDHVVKDKFLIELPAKVFEKLCEEDETLTLASAYSKALIRETKISQSASEDVNFIKSGGRRNNNNNNSKKSNGNTSNGKPHGESKAHGEKKPHGKCSHCGWKNHESASCKFKNAKCHSCGSVGHLKNICSKNSQVLSYISSNSNELENFSNDFLNSIYSIDAGAANDFDVAMCNAQKRYSLMVEINGHTMMTECDTGAPCSLMGKRTFDDLFNREDLQPCHTPYSGYTGDGLNLLGELTASVNYRGQIKRGKIVVTAYDRPTLLGRDFLRGFNFELVQVDKFGNIVNAIEAHNSYDEIVAQLKSQFSDVFDGKLGRYNISKVKLQLIEGAKPIFMKARPVPFAFKDRIGQAIDKLVETGVLLPVNDSEWATPIVPVLKSDGDFRICGDYKSTINKLLVDFKYPLPNIEEIFAKVQGGEQFSKLDLTGAYNQLELEEESQVICTLNTHKGLYRMTRLPFGVKVAAAIFQKTMDNLLKSFSSVFDFQDDIVNTGPNFATHLSTLKQVLQKLQEVGLRLNEKKCKFFRNKITYLGFDIDKNGLSKNQDRIRSVINSPTPTNISEVRAFDGMVNYHSKFIANFAEKMAPLYRLLRKEVEFEWNSECQRAFDLMKTEICSDKVLAHFDPSQTIVLATDACNTAVAGVLFHRYKDKTEKPVAYVSRALNSAERNYSTFEKEALAIIFAVVKLRQYLLGNKFILQTDHKPLVTIFGENKGIPVMAAARIQRWAFILSGFDYSIEYVKGSLNTADSLSRIPQFETVDPVKESNYINYVGFINVSLIDYKVIATHTRRDPILSKVMSSIHDGTVDRLKGDEFSPFRSKSAELTVEGGCILWGYRTVIPSKLQKEVLQALHTAHMGIVKTKSLARSYVYWPKIDHDIEVLVKSCDSCQRLQASPEKSLLIPWTPTDSAWQRIHIDFGGPVKGFYFFIVIDSFSKWAEVYKTKDMTTNFVTSKLREIMCRFGIVDTLVSDNGRQFTSEDFENFMSQNGIKHVLTAPGHPDTNGQAENFVKTFKHSFLKMIETQKGDVDSIINKFLFDYRITKHCTTNETPMKLMLGREVKSRFSLMRPPIVSDVIKEKQRNTVKNFKGKRNKTFSVGQKVYARNYKNPNKASWSPATVKRKIGPRNYTCLLTYENREIKRHVDQLRDGQLEEGDDMVANSSMNEVEDVELSGNEQLSDTSQSSHSSDANNDVDSTTESDDTEPNADESIADVVERPSVRDCANKAKDAITALFTSNRKR